MDSAYATPQINMKIHNFKEEYVESCSDDSENELAKKMKKKK
jgi:hypothetical protein